MRRPFVPIIGVLIVAGGIIGSLITFGKKTDFVPSGMPVGIVFVCPPSASSSCSDANATYCKNWVTPPPVYPRGGCATWNQAQKLLACDETGEMYGGDYPPQSVVGAPLRLSCPSEAWNAVLKPAKGADVRTATGRNLLAAAYLTIKGPMRPTVPSVFVAGAWPASTSEWAITGTHAVLDGISAGNVTITSGSYNTLRNSDVTCRTPSFGQVLGYFQKISWTGGGCTPQLIGDHHAMVNNLIHDIGGFGATALGPDGVGWGNPPNDTSLNGALTTASASITTTDEKVFGVTVFQGTNFPVRIDSEQILISTVSNPGVGQILTVAQRGYNGTTIAAHANGARVQGTTCSEGRPTCTYSYPCPIAPTVCAFYGNGFHTDGVFIRGCSFCLFAQNWMVGNSVTNIRQQDCCGVPMTDHLALINNIFQRPNNGAASDPLYDGDPYDWDTASADQFWGGNSTTDSCGGFVMSGSCVAQPATGGAYGSGYAPARGQFVGNLISLSGCIGSTDYYANAIQKFSEFTFPPSPCPGTGNVYQGNPWAGGWFKLVNTKEDNTIDAHLQPSSPANNIVPTSATMPQWVKDTYGWTGACAPADFYGNPRSQGAGETCDAGAVEGPDFYVAPVAAGGNDFNAGTKAAPFATFAKCYAAAAAIATTERNCMLAGGDYPSQQCNFATRAGSSWVNFIPAPGAKVRVNGSLFFGQNVPPTNWTTASCTNVRFLGKMSPAVGEGNSNFTIVGTGSGTAGVVALNGSADTVVIDGLDFKWFESWGTKNVTFKHVDMGPSIVTKPNGGNGFISAGFRQSGGVGGLQPTEGIVVEDSICHDANGATTADKTPPGEVHTQCLFINSVKGFTWRRNKCYLTAEFCLFRESGACCGGTPDFFEDVLIENSWFGTTPSCALDGDPMTCAPRGTAIAIKVPSTGPVKIRNNSFDRREAITCNTQVPVGTPPVQTYTCNENGFPVIFSGNIVQRGFFDCTTRGITRSYNVMLKFDATISSTPCTGSNDVVLPFSAAYDELAGKYMNQTRNAIDYHLSSASFIAKAYVPCAGVVGGCPTDDIDGQPRSASTNAGSDETTPGAAPPPPPPTPLNGPLPRGTFIIGNNESAPGTASLKLGPLNIVKVGPGDYRMWYEGSSTNTALTTINYATSTDGTTWTKYPANPIVVGTQAWENTEVSPGTVLYDASVGLWKMWYHGGDNPPGVRKIGYMTSADGITWTKYGGNPVLGPSVSGWDSGYLYDPRVIKVSPTDYRMWYTGNVGGNTTVNHRGYATSTDGITWTKYSGNPIFSPVAGQWDSLRIDGTWPMMGLSTGPLFQMWYVALDGAFAGGIGYASSPDGITWTRGPNNPVLFQTSTERISDPIFIYVDGNRLRFVYYYDNFTTTPAQRYHAETELALP